MNKTLIFILILVFSLSSFLFSEVNQIIEDVCIWKVESDSNTVYLMGSIHFLQESDYPLPDEFYTTFEDAENVVFEINYDSTQTSEFQQYTVLKAFCPDGETFQSMVSDSTYDITRKALLEFGTPLAQLQQFEPWFLAIMMLSLKLQQYGFNPKFGVDKYFFNKSKEEGKAILCFETPEYQMDLLESLGGDAQEKFLLKTIDELDEMETSFIDLVDAWKAADLEKLDELINAGFYEYPEIRQSLLLDRNYAWLNKIIEYIGDNKDYLIIVGSGHLAGDEGLVDLLRDEGYHVMQVKRNEK
ncbi:MAG TPA: TraB/GumN family protein [Candidatus Cloacimonetes bacterium]|nr:TraB/GumN family protein [Candidatus Cloacimonadota bacterium]HEX37625.1 TraB/GumN family protein [Candidatus Cloacimonadota bacterium]